MKKFVSLMLVLGFVATLGCSEPTKPAAKKTETPPAKTETK